MKEKLVVITGPTAVGKTEISIEIAKRLNGEIISADSMQIYKYMDIGTAKVRKDEMQGIKHHLVDFLEPDDEFTVANYKKKATNIITEINNIDKLPIVSGGTGLYINSLVYELDFIDIAPDEELREKYEDIARNEGKAYLLELLRKVDPITAAKYSENDVQRIVRALEVYYKSGISMSEQTKNFRKPNEKYEPLMYCLYLDREELYNRINLRVDLMIDHGFLHEVVELLNKGYSTDLTSMKAIGYRELIKYILGEWSLDEAINKIKQFSRNYAKRQLTWFRRDDRIHWIDVGSFENKIDLADYIERDIRKKY
ncbi:MAG: tRNA (adenosine(37)-N6)-dimethylallyltransferase MiaA [Gudongella sp.]|nr:tRNA (adenosine(37)-N6)-dimethylallyltransferase MiaA [Gudongella sp.]